jgi:phosphoglucosamine mutase
MKIVLDCANGAGYKSAPKMIKSLGVKLKVIGDRPNGFNINKNCGSTFPKKLQKSVKKYKAHLGISLDGDADRIIMCDEKGSIIDGDQIIAALAVIWKKKKILKGGVVGTLMSNYGLEEFLKLKNIKFLRAKVGDRYVKEIMQTKKFNLGGEQSGHIILGKFATTGDGLLVALEVIKALSKNIKASKFFDVFEKKPQILENVRIRKSNPLKKQMVKNSIKTANRLIKGKGRILVRKSGTEQKIRIMGESNDTALLKRCIKIITKTIN